MFLQLLMKDQQLPTTSHQLIHDMILVKAVTEGARFNIWVIQYAIKIKKLKRETVVDIATMTLPGTSRQIKMVEIV